ncbi:MAG: thiamine pyrophosphate-dependent enzyme [Dehalococcoidia bacterium]
MPELTGGQALVQSLKIEGVNTVFGLPGIQLDWAFDALWEERDSIRVVHPRHEQATAGMADGFARTTGRVGTALVVPGPGLLNATGALSTAYSCNSPVLMVAGQIQSDLIDVGRGVLHEIPNQLGMIRSVTKWAGRAMAPEEIPGLVHEAFKQLQSGRPRPVEIEIPPDVLQKKGDVTLLEPYQPDRAQPDLDLIEQAAKALGEAKNPLIFAGGGVLVSGAWEELQQLAAMLQAPVVVTANGKGAISDRNPLAQWMVAAPLLTPEADVILAVGTRFVQPATMPWGPKEGQRVIHLDIDPEEIGRNHKATDTGIVADAQAGLTALVERTGRYNHSRPSREDELRALQQRAAALLGTVKPQSEYALAIRAELPDDGILVEEQTQVGYWSRQGFPVYAPRTYLGPGYQGALGFGFSVAIGAQVANPDKKVVSVNGDGGFGFQLQELATIAYHDIPLATVIFTDDAYGNVNRIQRMQFDGHEIASRLKNPDFVKLAEAFGIEGRQAATPDALRGHLRDALSNGHPMLISVPIGEVPSGFGLQLTR